MSQGANSLVDDRQSSAKLMNQETEEVVGKNGNKNQLEQTATQIHFNFGAQQQPSQTQVAQGPLNNNNPISRGNYGAVAMTMIPGGFETALNANMILQGISEVPLTARQVISGTGSDFTLHNYSKKQQALLPLPSEMEVSNNLGMSPNGGAGTFMETIENEYDLRDEGTSPNLYRGISPATLQKVSNSEKKARLQFRDKIDVENNNVSSGESSPEGFQMYSPNQQITAVAQSPALDIRSQLKFMPDESQIHKDAYEKVSKFLPPNPILPKSFLVYDDSPRSGGEQAYIKLLKFRGKDFGRSKFEIEKGVQQIEFPEGVTLKSIFAPLPESTVTDDRKTAFGEIVYQRHALDFSNKNYQAGSKKDEVVEENLLDVRRILKNSQAAAGGANLTAGGGPGQAQQKKGLINLQGVDNFYKKKDAQDKTLIFESRFESGNLAAAVKISDNEYHLLLQNDVNTSGHTQWFFYRVQNTRRFQQVKFNMLNLSKPDSLFNEGMKVLVYSEKHSEEKDIGWHRTCSKIAYYHNGIKKDNQKKKVAAVGGGEASNSKTLYTLTFTYDFQYDDDTVYFAYCYPYNYSDMLDDLTKISTDPAKSSFCQRKTLCLSLAGNKVEMLTITSKNNLDNMSKRKGVFITSRVHPGESVGSWMMKGVIDYLTDENNDEAETLRQNFVFKIIPMLNPDGVINGNYRCSLAGCDLNRRWKAPSKVLHPCIYYTKQLLQQFSKERELVVFCDFHGHSRRKNIFMYGCQNEQNPEETRLYPFLMSKICPFFSFNYSRFGIQKSKEATARIAMFNEIKISAIYTMESSFCGMDEGPFANYHFSTDNLMQTGRDFCRTLLLFSTIPLEQRFTLTMLQQIKNLVEYKRQVLEKENPSFRDAEIDAMVQFFDKIKQAQADKKEVTTKRIRKGLLQVLRTAHDVGKEAETSSSAGSDKAPSEDNLEPEEIQMVVPAAIEDDQSKNKKKKKGDQPASQLVTIPAQDTSTSISPVRRQQAKEIRRLSTITKTKAPAALPTKSLKKENSKSNLKPSEEEKKEEPTEEDTKPQSEEPQVPASSTNQGTEAVDDTVTHKKKRKRNVESRDVWTQTDRSDYMLIKYRQKQKMAMQMAKGQKLTKEEQQMYEQALMQYKQQQAMNKTVDQPNAPAGITPPPMQNVNQKKEQNLIANRANETTRMMQGGNATMYAGQQQVNRDKADSTMVSQTNQLQISRNLNSAQSNSKVKDRKKIIAASGSQGTNGVQNQMNQGRSSQMIFQQNGQLYQLINNQAVPIKTQHMNEVQMRHLQALIENQGSHQPSLPLISSSSGKRKSQPGGNSSAPPGVGSSQKFSSPNKKGILQESNAGIILGQQQTFTLANQVIMNGGALPIDLTSSHSSQRIVNAGKLANANTIDGPSATSSYLMVIPSNNTGQQASSQRSSQGIFKGGGLQSAKNNNEGSTPPVLENAYIQKRLLEQQQQPQNEYAGVKPLGGATFFGGVGGSSNYPLEYHGGGGEMSRRKLGGMSLGHATNNEFFSNSNNNMLLKKMIDNQWQQAVALSASMPQNAQQQQVMAFAANAGQVSGSNNNSSQLFVGNYNPNNQQNTAYQNRTGRKNVSQKIPQQQYVLANNQQMPLFQGNQGRSSVQHSSNIIQGNPQPQLGLLQGSPIKMLMNQQQQQSQQNQSPLKINIVNVHNQFNIHNNIIINQSQQPQQPFMAGSGSMGAPNFFPAQQMSAASKNNSGGIPLNISQAPVGQKSNESPSKKRV